MNTLTIKDVLKMGGNEWVKGEMKRVYITQELFNKITDFGFRLNNTKWKFYIDQATGDIFRTKGKKPVREANISDFNA